MKFSNKQEFVSQEIADLVKSKGFDTNCLGLYTDIDDVITSGEIRGFNSDHIYYEKLAAPLYQQIIEWFEIKHEIYIYALRYGGVWTWKIDGSNGYLDYGKVEGGRKENLIQGIKKACQYI